MSIWSSISSGLQVPECENYTGETIEPPVTVFQIDVATATSWNDAIRLSVDEVTQGRWHGVEALLMPSDAESLIAMLTEALDRIRKAPQ